MAHVIITGGSSGIGAALARRCAGRGDAVSLIARSPEPLRRLQHELSEQAGRVGQVTAEAADVADAAAVTAAIGRCEAASGPCDLLITSAGIVLPARFDEQKPADFEAQIRTNLLGTVNTVRAVYAGMRARRRGRILLIGSGAGLIGIYGYTAYCASKAALLGFAEALRLEARPLGIGVSICLPPDTETSQLAAELRQRPDEARAIIGNGRPMTAEQVAAAALAGAERGRFTIYPGAQMRMLGLFGSLAKPLLRAWHDRRIAALGRLPGKR